MYKLFEKLIRYRSISVKGMHGMPALSSLLFLFFLQWLALSGCNTQTDHLLPRQQMINYQQYRWEKDSTVLVFSSNFRMGFQPFVLKPGKYSLVFKAHGSIAGGVLPKLMIFMGEETIADQEIAVAEAEYKIRFEAIETIDKPLQFAFTNDYSTGTEDRNVFLHFPVRILAHR
jgi:hypothetical protein